MSYWEDIASARLSRRRAFGSISGLAAAGAILAACGGGNSEPKAPANSLLSEPQDTSKQARKGGTLKNSVAADVPSFHPYIISSPTSVHTGRVYSWLLMPKPTIIDPYRGEIEGDLAESWELSGDKLQLTLKLRRNARFDPRPPTNGRLADANDVVFSWKMIEAMASRRADIANSANPASPVVSMTAADSNTVVVKLAAPNASLLTLLSKSAAQNGDIIPREAEGGFDLRTDMRGSGPFYLDEYVPSNRFVYKRNPGYYDSQMPFVDGIDCTLITEYATGLAQFRNGGIHQYAVRPEDILQTKYDVQALEMHRSDITALTGRMFYGYAGTKPPFADERVRQAFSMSLDRITWVDAFYNVATYANAGLPVTRRFNTAVNAAAEGWWLDPESKEFGENAKYYDHNVAEAKKLLSAAGYANGVDLDAHYPASGYGVDFSKNIEAMIGMVADAGIRVKSVLADFNTDWRPRYADAKGNFDGLGFINLSIITEPGHWMSTVYNSSGAAFKGFYIEGSAPASGDPTLNSLTSKIMQEFDMEKRWALGHDLQRYEAKKQYAIPFPGGANGFSLGWPAVGNTDVFKGGRPADLFYWLDDKKAPLAKS